MPYLAQFSLLASTVQAEDDHILQQNALIKCLLITVQHFFGGFERLLKNVTDPRHPAFITCP
jgi:hypothetical protein